MGGSGTRDEKQYTFTHFELFFLLQDRNFHDIHTLLFDGETGLKTKKAQQLIMDKYQIKLHADPGSKRNQAERGIRGTTLFLEKKLNKDRVSFVCFVCFVFVFCFLFFVFCVLFFCFLVFVFCFCFCFVELVVCRKKPNKWAITSKKDATMI